MIAILDGTSLKPSTLTLLFDLWVVLTLAGSPQRVQMFRQAMREAADPRESGQAVCRFCPKYFEAKLKIMADFLLDIQLSKGRDHRTENRAEPD